MTVLRTGSRSFRHCAPAAALLAFAFSSAHASTQDPSNEKRLASSVMASLPAEINYDFDAALNTTHATYKTSLGAKSFFKRFLTGSPAVHTVAVSYDFDGRSHAALPQEVEFVFTSDEYRADDDAAPFARRGDAPLQIRADGSIFRYAASIAQRIEVHTDTVLNLNRFRPSNSENTRMINSRETTVHVNQTATAWMPIQDFLMLVNAHEVRGSITGLDFQFSDEVLAGLRRFAAEMVPPTVR